MTSDENFVVISARCKNVVYEEGFAMKIEDFENWWSSIRLDEPVRSQMFQMEVAGTQHKFQLSLMKYIEYEEIVDSHTIMLSLSLFYHGPANSIVIKPDFKIRTTDNITQTLGRTLKTKRLYKNTHSDPWVWSEHWLRVYKDEWNLEGDGSLTFCSLIKIKASYEPPGNISLQHL